MTFNNVRNHGFDSRIFLESYERLYRRPKPVDRHTRDIVAIAVQLLLMWLTKPNTRRKKNALC